MEKEDCRIYPEYSGEHLACEIRNERLGASWQQGFAFGGLLFFIIGLTLMWVICWAKKKDRELNQKYPH